MHLHFLKLIITKKKLVIRSSVDFLVDLRWSEQNLSSISAREIDTRIKKLFIVAIARDNY